VFTAQYSTAAAVDVLLQAVGSFLLVVFALALLHLAGVGMRFAARVTEVAAATILAVSLFEAAFEIDIVQAVNNGHLQAALTSYDLTYVFVHIFGIAPSLTLLLGIALLGTRLLPRVLVYLALALGAAMTITGFVALFNPAAVGVYIGLLIAQTFWFLAAGIAVVLRAGQVEAPYQQPMLPTR
jgi:hypothetical protein